MLPKDPNLKVIVNIIILKYMHEVIYRDPNPNIMNQNIDNWK